MTSPRKPHLMLVEDERVVALNLSHRLEQLGYDVKAVAASGEEALDRARAAWPDLVLMDIRIEGAMDGIETAERLNGIRPIPVVYLTAHADEATLLRARASTPFGYLLKPFSEREMHATIQMALARFEAQETVRQGRDHAQRMNAELGLRVRERTASLEQSLAELETFCHAVAHDLRAPLRAIAGMSRILVEDHSSQLNREAKRLLGLVTQAAVHMGRMIDGLLTLARVSRTAMDRREVDLGVVAREITRRLTESEPARRVEFLVAQPALAQADANTVEVVVENLLQNAWKFTSQREHPRIEFGYRRFPDETVFYVADDGVGFDMSHVSKLFQPFERLHGDRDFPGDGIGLATVKRIVERHGGRIWAVSEVDRGTTIYFTLAPAVPTPSLEGALN